MDLDSLAFLGEGLCRPECVLAHRSGALFCSDSRGNGGVAIIRPSGEIDRITAKDIARPLHPNGIAMLADGAFLIAHLGVKEGDGGVWRLDGDGHVSPFLIELGGVPLPPTNFALLDTAGRVWISVSTRLHPRWRAYRADADDGFVILVDGRGARIVADGLGYTNECVVDVENGLFYINETFSRRISRFRIAADGSLMDHVIVAEFGAGTYPDGLSLDAEGGMWITSVISNRLIHIQPNGRQTIMLEDADATYLAKVETSFTAGRMNLADINGMPDSRLKNLSSLAFAGLDLTLGVLGSLGNDRLATVQMPVRGRAPAHFDFELPSSNTRSARSVASLPTELAREKWAG